VNSDAIEDSPPTWVRTFRNWTVLSGLFLWILWYVPPFSTWATRYEFAQVSQFCSFAFLIPALLVTGAPWKKIGLASHEVKHVAPDGSVELAREENRFVDRVIFQRSIQENYRRFGGATVVFLGLVIFWRVAPVVDSVVRHAWLVVPESLSLIGAGIIVWSDLVESPPLSPSVTRPLRIGVATVTMWIVWILAYMDAMSHTSWYSVFHHVAGHGLSRDADQQLSAGAMWFLSAGAFMPVIFWNLVHWLQSEENPTDELRRLVREEKLFGAFEENQQEGR
jgi:cytochrome c oxidase assembly factor CtaG